jgi:hypothetical protein
MKRYLLFLLIFILAGCMQNLRFESMDKHKITPGISYEAYYYVEGTSDRSRAVFLKYPDAQIEVAAPSPQITATTSSYNAAIAYMDEAKDLRTISITLVTYKGKPLGYLFTYNDDPVQSNLKIDVDFYESGGKVYFTARERSDHEK